jgi:hypothetical protein
MLDQVMSGLVSRTALHRAEPSRVAYVSGDVVSDIWQLRRGPVPADEAVATNPLS